ncbi:MAG: hypothetical protein M9888_11080 [Chitinophagales bacterium]|nr:hypothetical protein [Chitinophagales bacterium]
MESVQLNVLSKLAGGQRITTIKRSLVRINGLLVHYRMKSQASDGASKFPFNINPTTLTADFEIWICGSEEIYYVIPKTIIKKIYDDPDTYTNKTPNQEDIKTLTVNTFANEVAYGRNGKKLDIAKYRNIKLTDLNKI